MQIAVTTLAILLGIGLLAGGAVYASGEYGGWVGIRTKTGIEITYDVKAQRSYGEYKLHDTHTINVAPSDLENYEQSLFYSKYKADGIDYRNAETENTMDISLGSTDTEYWKHYFGYDETGEYFDYENAWNENEHTMLESETVEYEGLKLFYLKGIVYYDSYDSTDDGKMEYTKITWVDHEKGICVSMYINTLVEQEEILGYAKQFIDDYQ